MKILVFFLLLIPILGIAQTQKGAMNLLHTEYFDFNHGATQQIDWNNSKVSGHSKPLTSPYLNTTDEYKTLLDSLYKVDFNPTSNTSMLIREYYKYDDKGNVLLLTNYTPCEGCAVSTYKIESEFDVDSKITMDSYYFWDFTANQWVRARKNIYAYDTKGYLITFTENMWYNGAKLNPGKTEFSNDDHGNVLSKIRSRYDSITGEWVGDNKEEYAYKNDKCTLHIEYNWDKVADQWKNSTKDESDYDGNGNQIWNIIYQWKEANNQWYISSKYDITYASNGKTANYSTFNWNISKNQWINEYKTDYSYDAHENEILHIDYEWNTTTNQWITNAKVESFYNAKELLDSLIVQAGNGSSKEEYEYDRDGNNTIKIHYNWNSITKDWNVWNKYNYYYSLHALTNGLNITDNQKVKLYPNPSHERLNLEINDRSVTNCELYNSKGQLLKILAVVQGINTYNISPLKDGIYLIKIQSKEGMTIKKIIKN